MTSDGSGDWITPYPAMPCIRLVLRTRSFRSTLIDTGVGDNPDWTERMKEGWESSVIDVLDSLRAGSWTQKVVLGAIQNRCAQKNYRVYINPRETHPQNTASKGTNELEILDQILNSAATGNSTQQVPQDGETAYIYYEPHSWRADSFIRQEAELVNPSRFGGVGMEPDQVLFHELVHAVRRLSGTTDRTPTQNRDYVNLEEFAAVLFTNISMNEKNPFAPLRYCERSFIAMSPQYQTSASFLKNSEHHDLVGRIVRKDPQLTQSVANSNVHNPFNPLRRYLRGAVWKDRWADW